MGSARPGSFDDEDMPLLTRSPSRDVLAARWPTERCSTGAGRVGDCFTLFQRARATASMVARAHEVPGTAEPNIFPPGLSGSLLPDVFADVRKLNVDLCGQKTDHQSQLDRAIFSGGGADRPHHAETDHGGQSCALLLFRSSPSL